MSKAETIYQLVQTIPEEQVNMVLKFVEFLWQEKTSFSIKQTLLDRSSEFSGLYGSCSNEGFEVDDEGISDQMDDDLTGVFD